MLRGGLIVMLNALLAWAVAASVTVTVTLKGLPTALVGVPEMTPVAGTMFNPGGRPVADHV
jgi:hypothetical protein